MTETKLSSFERFLDDPRQTVYRSETLGGERCAFTKVNSGRGVYTIMLESLERKYASSCAVYNSNTKELFDEHNFVLLGIKGTLKTYAPNYFVCQKQQMKENALEDRKKIIHNYVMDNYDTLLKKAQSVIPKTEKILETLGIEEKCEETFFDVELGKAPDVSKQIDNILFTNFFKEEIGSVSVMEYIKTRDEKKGAESFIKRKEKEICNAVLTSELIHEEFCKEVPSEDLKRRKKLYDILKSIKYKRIYVWKGERKVTYDKEYCCNSLKYNWEDASYILKCDRITAFKDRLIYRKEDK